MRDDPKAKDFLERMAKRADNMEPILVSPNANAQKRALAEQVLPEGSSLAEPSSRTAAMGGFGGMGGSAAGGGSTNFHTRRPYLPEFDSPDRQFYPHDRATANKYWRLFYKTDPIFGTATDMYSQMMVSEFDISLDEEDIGIKNELMDMVEDVYLHEKLQQMVKEYLVLGEVLPHNFFDESTGKWSYIGFHDPDYIDIQDSPIIDMEPIINFIPDDRLRDMLVDSTPEAQELRQQLPTEFVSKVLAHQKIRLSPVNCSYIPRKLHPYDERGVSLASRLWRIWMVEDAVYNCTIATFRRAAAPLRVCKLGDPATGWMPGPETEQKLSQMLVQAEFDPASFLIWNYGIQFEAFGINERSVTISREHDTIEKVKLLALGLSKSFMSGEVSFSCFLKDAEVLSDKGTFNPIESISEGDYVLDKMGNRQKVTDTMKYPSPDNMTKVTLYGNKEIVATENHKFPMFIRPRKCLCGCGELLGDKKTSLGGCMTWSSFLVDHHQRCDHGGSRRVWVEYKNDDKVVVKYPKQHQPYRKVEAKNIKVGDYMLVPRKFDVADTPSTEENLDRARLLGYYVAEGDCYDVTKHIGTKSARRSFGKLPKEEVYADAVRLGTKLGYHPTINKTSNDCNVVRFPAKDTPLADWLIASGSRYSGKKKLSPEVTHWNLDLKKELLIGMYRGDGHMSQRGSLFSVIYTTISRVLAQQLELILAQLGYASHTHITPGFICDRGYDHKDSYILSVNGKAAYGLAEFIWGDVEEVWSKYDFTSFFNGNKQGDSLNIIKDDDYLYLPVKSVETIPVDKEENPYVYNITVDNTNSYITNNIASFNSARSGLQVFLRRLLSMRQFFENTWILPKFFAPIIRMNDWTKSSKSEVAHRYRIKRTSQEKADRNLYIRPRLKWQNKLDPAVDAEMMQAYIQLKSAF